jgi:alpha-tubulin suppressor-like RCC1 family protein
MCTRGPGPGRGLCRRLLLVAALAALGACGDDDALPADDDDGATEPDAAGQADAAGQPDGSPDPDTGTPDASVAPSVVSLSMGNSIACAVVSTGEVRCWGANEQGQVGTGAAGPDIGAPADVVDLDDALTVDCGTATCCARTTAGSVQCWGWNDVGVLGANDLALPNRPTPGPVMQEPRGGGDAIELSDVSQFALGAVHGCAIQGGEVLCWGWNSAGQAGIDPPPDRSAVARLNGITGVVSLSLGRVVGTAHSCAITGEGGAACWGFNDRGQLGDGTQAGRSAAAPVVGIIDVTAVAPGGAHACAIGREADDPKATPGVFCWGDNFFFQAVPGGPNPQLTPIRLAGVDGAIAIAAGQSHSCAVLDSGAIRCWGANNFGQLGSGAVGDPPAAPVDVVGPTGKGTLTGAVQVTAGFGNTCARTAASEVFCWGESVRGQLGQGDAKLPPVVPTPVEVPVLPPN